MVLWSEADLTRVCQSLPMEWPDPPFFGRPAFKHTVLKVRPYAFDDLYELNTQSGSQWDGFRHVSLPLTNSQSQELYLKYTGRELIEAYRPPSNTRMVTSGTTTYY